MAACRILCVLFSLLVSVTWSQFSVDHVGDFVDHVDGYMIQYHDEVNLLLVGRALDCYIGKVVRGTPLANKLEDPATRMSTQRSILTLIKAGHITATDLGDVLEKYHDTTIRAYCWVAEVYMIDLSSLQGTNH